MSKTPEWSRLVRSEAAWVWAGDRLVQAGAKNARGPIQRSGGIGSFVVEHVYGRQNNTRSVRRIIGEAAASLGRDEYGMNFGAGKVRISPQILNLDIAPGPTVDILSAGGLDTPFHDRSLSLVVCQEVLEHVARPDVAIAEFRRVLKPGGMLVLQLPFIIGYHPGPRDFWRFSTEAYGQLLDAGEWRIIEKQITVGHGSGMHRILTEFVAVHFSVFGGRVYRAAKGFAALLLSPLILFDLITPYLPERDRIAGGYIVRAERLN